MAGTGAVLTYCTRDDLHAAAFTPGAGWSKPQRVAGGDTANGYRLLTSRTSSTVAILDGSGGLARSAGTGPVTATARSWSPTRPCRWTL